MEKTIYEKAVGSRVKDNRRAAGLLKRFAGFGKVHGGEKHVIDVKNYRDGTAKIYYTRGKR